MPIEATASAEPNAGGRPNPSASGTAAVPAVERRILLPISDNTLVQDSRARWRRAGALLGALLIHLLVALLLLATFSIKRPPAPPPSILAELVPEIPRKPVPEKPAVAPPQPPPPPNAEKPRESGGDTKRAPGASAAATPPQAKPVPPPPTTPRPAKSASASPLPKARETGELPPFGVAPALRKGLEATNPVAPPHKPPAKSTKRSRLTGEGGGDRYLNAVLAQINRYRVHPAAASFMHLSGTARYEIIIDRGGHLLDVYLLESSGNGILDEAGMQTVQHAAPFEPPPPDIPDSPLRLVLTLPMDES